MEGTIGRCISHCHMGKGIALGESNRQTENPGKNKQDVWGIFRGIWALKSFHVF